MSNIQRRDSSTLADLLHSFPSISPPRLSRLQAVRRTMSRLKPLSVSAFQLDPVRRTADQNRKVAWLSIPFLLIYVVIGKRPAVKCQRDPFCLSRLQLYFGEAFQFLDWPWNAGMGKAESRPLPSGYQKPARKALRSPGKKPAKNVPGQRTLTSRLRTEELLGTQRMVRHFVIFRRPR